MTGLQLAILSGVTLASGGVIAARALRPAPPSLEAALTYLSAAPVGDRVVSPSSAHGGPGWLPARLAAALGARVGMRDADLLILDRTRAQFAARQLALTLAGVFAPSVIGILLLLLGFGSVATLPALVGCLLAAVGWMLPTWEAKEKAAAARAEFRTNLEFFLTLVAGERRARGSVEQALEEAVQISNSRPFLLMRQAIRRAALAGRKPWADLRDLGADLDVPELRNLADIAESAADGAAVYNTLLATARTLRHAELTDARADANQVSERMSRPLGLLVFGLTLFVLVPFMLRMLGVGI